MTTNLYIIRHGEAYSNVESIMEGIRSDRGLTERGKAQVRALAQRLEHQPIPADVLYASNLPRARMTAETIAPVIGLPIEWDEELQELRPGEADGMRVEDARQRFDGFNRFFQELFTPIAPGGESWASFQFRGSAALERLIERHRGQNIVVVAHGGIVEVSFMYLLQLGPQVRSRAAFHVQNTAITHWRHNETLGGRSEWHLMAHNDHWHLNDIP